MIDLSGALPLLAAVFDFPGGLAVGFAALVTTGISWTLVGVVMGSAARKGVNTSYVQFFGALVSLLISVIVVAAIPVSGSGTFLTVSCYFLTGSLNFIMLEMTAKAMSCGPNGVIWGMVQSGTLWPFVMGVAFFDVAPTPWRLGGMVSLIVALFLFGNTQSGNNSTGGKNWLLPAVIAFCMCGTQQCITSLPSYFEAGRDFSPVLRSLLSAAGTISAAVVWNIVLVCCGKLKVDFAELRKPLLWLYVLILQGFGLLAAYFLMYDGMDTLAAAGIGAISYPLMVASCIVGFSLYSIFCLRERNRLPQYLAFLLCLTGIILLCSG